MSTFNLRKIIEAGTKHKKIGKIRATHFSHDTKHHSYLANILALYTENNHGSNETGAISYKKLIQNTSLDDRGRKQYIMDTLANFRENPEFGKLTEKQIDGVIRIHHKYANTREYSDQGDPKYFFDLSKEERKKIKEELKSIGINKNRQDLLVYHGICSRGKAVFILLFILGISGGYIYRSGIGQASLTQAPVITPEMYEDKTQMPLIISPDELVRGIADSIGVQWITTDTFSSFQRFLTTVDPTKGQGGFRNNTKRGLGISTAEFDNRMQYFAQLGYTMNDIDRMIIDGKLDDSQDTSTITISGLPCISFPNVTPTNKTVANQIDRADFTDDNLIKNINLESGDSIVSYVSKRALPASAFHKDNVLRNVGAIQGEGMANLYFGGSIRLGQFPEKTVIVNFKFTQKMPSRNENRKNGPTFSSEIEFGSEVKQYFATPAGAEKEINVTVIKKPGETKFKLQGKPIITSNYHPTGMKG